MEMKVLNGRGFHVSEVLQIYKQQQYQEGLSLDPQRNHHHHFHHLDPRNVDADQRDSGHPPPFQPPQQPQQEQAFSSQFYMQQSQTGTHLRDLYSQLEPQNLEPIKKRSYITSSSSAIPASTQHVRQKAAMEDSFVQQQANTRTALRKAGIGEIVQVQGGHIVRATGRKDRHSKVCTAKGPRDRRVRLSAHTAIQFYDVQDRLGYDRPSKAVDWLIKKAKAAIDELEQLPAWSPSSMNVSTPNRRRGGKSSGGDVAEELQEDKGGGGGEGMYGGEEQPQQQQQLQYNNANNNNNSSSSLLPPSLDSDAIADTIKSFFPMGGGGNVGPTTTSSASESPMQFHDYSQSGLFQRGGGGDGAGRSQDLKLSLQSFHDPILMHHSHSHHHGGGASHDEHQHSLFPGAVPIGFDNLNAGWVDNQHQPSPELGRLHRLVVGWNTQQHTGTEHHGVGTGSGGGGFVFNQPSPLLQPLFGGGQHSQLRGPLQSSNTPSVRAWISDPNFSIASSSEHHNYSHQAIALHPQALSGLSFTSGGFSGFHIPARIRGEEEHDGDPNRPSSASSGSRH